MAQAGVPTRPITRGPKYHWFGYYDKLQFDPTGRWVLGMEVDFEHHSPEKTDEIAVGLIDLAEGDRWTEIDRTRAWCWQQGCMLQWRPGSASEIIWNDRENGRFVSRLHDLSTRETRTIDDAVYTLSPNGRTAVGTDFRRINHMRPGYGYAGLPDPNHDILAPENAGIYTVDLDSGSSELILSIAEVAAVPYPHRDLRSAKHYFNHLLFNTDGSRFVFLHRWRFGDEGFATRMLSAAVDGSDLHVVDDSGRMSHFIWRDPQHILGWSCHPNCDNRFYLFTDRSAVDPEAVAPDVMTVNGHCTYLPGGRWILNDTYPDREGRAQVPYLCHVETGERIDLGVFHSPPDYTKEWRCDLHPRSSPDGRLVTIDSAHAGEGRQIYLIDVSAIIE